MTTKEAENRAKVESIARAIFIERIARFPNPAGFTEENIEARLEEQAFLAFEAAEIFLYSAEAWAEASE